ncbi:MAG TPA: MFS transporter [Fimbriimonadaceae bacterium]|nr:MFS transporter [Fimbriimonadaceae bacterium]
MRLPALQHANFRNYLAGTFVSNVGSNMQALAIVWQVFDLTGSSLMVGLLGLVRVVPLLCLTLFAGVLADQTDRRRLMLITQTAMALVSLTAFLLTVNSLITVGLLYAIVALQTVARAFDGPARQSMFATLVPARDFPNAASLNGMSWRLSDVLGPVIAGFMVQNVGSGLALCYGINLLTFSAVLFAVWRLPPNRPDAGEDHARTLGDVFLRIGEGFQFIRRTPAVRSAMWIDFWATLFSGADALFPAMATTVLNLGPQALGLLQGSVGAGALIGATHMAWRPTIHRQGLVVVSMIASYGVFTILFGFATSLWFAMICLAGVGASDMISTVLRQTIRQLATPDAMRGRMNATCSLFHISGPQLGDLEAGAVASLGGERFSIVLGGSLCLGVALLFSRGRGLIDYTHDAEKHA